MIKNISGVTTSTIRNLSNSQESTKVKKSTSNSAKNKVNYSGFGLSLSSSIKARQDTSTSNKIKTLNSSNSNKSLKSLKEIASNKSMISSVAGVKSK